MLRQSGVRETHRHHGLPILNFIAFQQFACLEYFLRQVPFTVAKRTHAEYTWMCRFRSSTAPGVNSSPDPGNLLGTQFVCQFYGATTFSPFFLLGSQTKKNIGFSHNPGFRPKFLVHCPFRPCHKHSQDLPCGVSVSIQYHRVFVYIKRLKVRFFDSQRY